MKTAKCTLCEKGKYQGEKGQDSCDATQKGFFACDRGDGKSCSEKNVTGNKEQQKCFRHAQLG